MEKMVIRKAAELAMLALVVMWGVPGVSMGESFFEKQNKAAQEAARQRQQQSQQLQQQQATQQGAPAAQGQQPGYPADFGTPEGTARIAATARLVDVLGVKIGMEAKDVLPALKASASNYKITTSHVYEDTNYSPTDKSGPLHAVQADNPQQMDRKTMAFEKLAINLTAPPGVGYVYGIGRTVPFPEGGKPTEATLIESLRKKYGPETANPDTAYTGPGSQGLKFGARFPNTVNSVRYLWVFDGQGHLVKSQDAEDVMKHCPKEGIGGSAAAELILKTFYAQGRPEAPPFSQSCSTSTVIDVTLNIAPNGLVNQMDIAASNLLLRDSGELSTWTWLDQRAKGQAEKEREDAKKVGAPKL